MITAGIDVGSISTKAAIIKDGDLIGTLTVPTGYNVEKAIGEVYSRLLNQLDLNIEVISRVVSTGYGRNRVLFSDKSITEISCHAAGVRFLNPDIRCIIDIGGQDSKAIVVDDDGSVVDFIMNDKCAAGTGRFLEVMARALEVDLDAFGQLSMKAEKPASISSLCTVFAESEVISLISKGENRSNIIAGIHESIASRVSAMCARIGMHAPLIMTGGVAQNAGVVRAIEKKLNLAVSVSEHAQANGAIGASILAFQHLNNG